MVRPRKSRAVIIHALRVAMVAALLLLIPSPSDNRSGIEDGTRPPSLEQIQAFLPAASRVDEVRDSSGLWAVKDESGATVARVARTLPEASKVIGYRGPSEAMILLDERLAVIAVDLIASDDTDEHVAAVEEDERFFRQFETWQWSGPDPGGGVDAVSGATLTSLALAKGVMTRLGGDRPSLVFPDEIAPAELESWFPEIATTRVDDELTIAVDADGKEIGAAARTGPLSDNVIGYQGPTELLIKVERGGAVERGAAVERTGELRCDDIKIRSSFDNQPYVRYCKTEYGFWKIFEGKSVDELADMDLEEARVEGVSGATMTSMAIAETLVAASGQWRQRARSRRESAMQVVSLRTRVESLIAQVREIRPSAADWACLAILGLIPLFRACGWFRRKRARLFWLISVVIVIGLWSGNLISMALIAGWSGGGIGWKVAPALAAIVFVALLCPPLAKANPYCNHLCPHGAIQQLIRPSKKSRRYWKPPAKLIAALTYLPGVSLTLAYLMLLITPTIDLSSWEPFHAYLFRLAPWSSILLAALTILFSAFIPMGYCRMGCPTGRLLHFFRRSAGSDQLGFADAVTVTLLVLALARTFAGGLT